MLCCHDWRSTHIILVCSYSHIGCQCRWSTISCYSHHSSLMSRKRSTSRINWRVCLFGVAKLSLCCDPSTVAEHYRSLRFEQFPHCSASSPAPFILLDLNKQIKFISRLVKKDVWASLFSNVHITCLL